MYKGVVVQFKRFSFSKPNISSKKFLLGLGFVSGFLLGYLLGLFQIHKLVPNSLFEISLDFSWIGWFAQITPDPTFLSDVAAFEAVIIAFLVPLSIEIISKISERYNSDVITRVFEDRLENRLLPPFLLINIVAAVILRFLVQEEADSMIWKIAAWIILLIFILIAFAIWRVIIRIKVFVTDTKSVVDQLYQDAEKSIT